MKNTWVVAGVVALGAFSFSSCSLEPYVITTEEQYMRDFIKKFGLVDAEQDWNMAKSEDINVNAGSGVKHLKLYAKVGMKYYLIADYHDVEGTLSIPVDVPADTKDILAIADGRYYYGTIGSTLDCTGTGSRASGDSTDNFPDKSELTALSMSYKLEVRDYSGNVIETLEKSIETNTTKTIEGKDYTVYSGYLTNENDPRAFERFNAQQISPITSNRVWRDYYSLNGNSLRRNYYTVNNGFGLLPEDGLKASPKGNTENPGIMQNFTVIPKDGKIVIYPMYWNSSQIHELGIYLYKEDGTVLEESGKPVLFPIFLDKRNDNGKADLYVYEKARPESWNADYVHVWRGGYADCMSTVPDELRNGSGVMSKYFDEEGNPKSDYFTKKEGEEYYHVQFEGFKSFMEDYVAAFNNPSNWQYFKTIFPDKEGYRLVRLECGNWAGDGDEKDITFHFYFENPANYPNASEVSSYLTETGGEYKPAKINNRNLEGDNDFGAYLTQAPLLVKNRAYFVHLPKDYDRKVGMYIKFNDIVRTGEEKILYSEKRFNTDSNYGSDSFACSFLHPESGHTFFSFEDWTDSNTDRDLNDLIFRLANYDEITGDEGKITEISDEPISWIWAVEDLGSTDDFDFNDIVMRITSVTTNVTTESSDGAGESTTETKSYKKVTFTPLAAGGTLPTYIHWKKSATEDFVLAPGVYYEDKASTDKATYRQPLESLNITTNGGVGAEYHSWFGNYPHTTMINTEKISVPQESIRECVIYLNSQFSISGFGNARAIDGNGKGLFISINGPTEGENTVDVDYQKASDANYNVSAPEKGAPAQMFIILDDNWAWPTERTHISEAYPLFKAWVANKSLDWTTTRGAGKVVNR